MLLFDLKPFKNFYSIQICYLMSIHFPKNVENKNIDILLYIYFKMFLKITWIFLLFFHLIKVNVLIYKITALITMGILKEWRSGHLPLPLHFYEIKSWILFFPPSDKHRRFFTTAKSKFLRKKICFFNLVKNNRKITPLKKKITPFKNKIKIKQ